MLKSPVPRTTDVAAWIAPKIAAISHAYQDHLLGPNWAINCQGSSRARTLSGIKSKWITPRMKCLVKGCEACISHEKNLQKAQTWGRASCLNCIQQYLPLLLSRELLVAMKPHLFEEAQRIHVVFSRDWGWALEATVGDRFSADSLRSAAFSILKRYGLEPAFCGSLVSNKLPIVESFSNLITNIHPRQSKQDMERHEIDSADVWTCCFRDITSHYMLKWKHV